MKLLNNNRARSTIGIFRNTICSHFVAPVYNFSQDSIIDPMMLPQYQKHSHHSQMQKSVNAVFGNQFSANHLLSQAPRDWYVSISSWITRTESNSFVCHTVKLWIIPIHSHFFKIGIYVKCFFGRLLSIFSFQCTSQIENVESGFINISVRPIRRG